MEAYQAWDTGGLNHAAQAFPTHALLEIERCLPEAVKASAETGCGKSTILLSNLSERHHVFALDDRDQGDASSVGFYERCPLTRLDRVTPHFGPTQITLPTFQHEGQYDLVLIDGPHGYPFPEMEYLSFYPHLREGGVLIIDDIRIPTIGRLADFIAEDAMFDLMTVVAHNTAIFRRTGAPAFNPHGDGWWEQAYNRRRVSPKREIYLNDEAARDAITSQKFEQIAHGDPEQRRAPWWRRPRARSAG